jgi:hypothetical protein
MLLIFRSDIDEFIIKQIKYIFANQMIDYPFNTHPLDV